MRVNYSQYNKKTIKNSNYYEKIVKNDEKVLEIIRDLLYNKHWACKNTAY